MYEPDIQQVPLRSAEHTAYFHDFERQDPGEQIPKKLLYRQGHTDDVSWELDEEVAGLT